ncbi:Rab guanyl-nucleotide exchange factor [Aureococcus anophagefferens]|nr:Rab guanyl-nucleotide exchange factor [Aureococcus anophagefferens]
MRFDHTVNCVSLSGSTRRVAACAREVVVVYDFDSRCVVFRLDAGDALYSVALSRSGKSVLFGGASKEVKLCDVTTAALRYEARADDRVRGRALRRRRGAGRGFDATLRLHHVGRGAPCAVGECGATARAVAVDRAGAVLAVGGDGGVPLLRPARVPVAAFLEREAPGQGLDRLRDSGRDPRRGRRLRERRRALRRGRRRRALAQDVVARQGAPFTWAVHFSGDGNTLAIGHWDAYAYLVDAADLREFGAIERGDRVSRRAVERRRSSPSAAGQARGGLAVDGDHIAALFETVHEAFVYAVALSRDRRGNRAIRASFDARARDRHDDAVLAVGRVDCLVAVFDVASEARTATIAMEGLVQNLCFAPAARDLAIAAEQNTVDVNPVSGESILQYAAGSDHRSPADFWSDFLVKAGARFRYFEHRESDDGAAHRPSGAFHARNSLRHMLSRRSFDGAGRAAPTFANFATLGGAGVRAHLKKTEVAAMIVPFERVLGTFGATP